MINANTSALREIVLVSAPLVPTELADYFLTESPISYLSPYSRDKWAFFSYGKWYWEKIFLS